MGRGQSLYPVHFPAGERDGKYGCGYGGNDSESAAGERLTDGYYSYIRCFVKGDTLDEGESLRFDFSFSLGGSLTVQMGDVWQEKYLKELRNILRRMSSTGSTQIGTVLRFMSDEEKVI